MFGRFLFIEGNCKYVALKLSQCCNADLLELKPDQDIPTKGFMKFVWGGHQIFSKHIPELQPLDINFSEYDLIFLGTPVWAANMSPSMKAFLKKDLVHGKKVALYCCHEGMKGRTLSRMEDILKENNQVIGTKDFISPLKRTSTALDKKITDWFQAIQYLFEGKSE